MTHIKIQFKDPDAIWEIINAKLPLPADEDDITPRMENERTEFSKKYFEYGDYGVISINPETLECKLLSREEW